MRVDRAGQVAIPSRRRSLPRSVYRIVIAVIGVCWVAITVYVLIPGKTADLKLPAAPLAAEPSSLLFGAVWNTDHFQWTVPVHNVSNEWVHVKRLKTSCTCTSVSPSAFTLKPGESVDLRLTFDFAERLHQWPDRPEMQFAQSVSAYVDDDGSYPVATWELKGVVKNAFFVRSGELNFGETLVEGQPFPLRSFEVVCFKPCRDLEASLDSQSGTVRVERSQEREDRFRILVAPKASLDVGVHRLNVRLKALLQTGEQTGEVPIAIEARVLQDLQILPAVAHFGDLGVGQTREQVFTIGSRTGRPVRIVSSTVDSKDAEVTLLSSKDGQAAVRVKVRSSRCGSQDVAIRFKIDFLTDASFASARPSNVLVLKVGYFGMPAKGRVGA
jgi:hypothetical protein